MLIIPLLLLTVSCNSKGFLPIASEINQMSVIQMMAIDKDGDEISITLSKRDINDKESESNDSGGDKGGKEESGGQSGKGAEGKGDDKIIKAKAKTISEVLRKLQRLTDKKLFFGDLDYCFIGEKAAKDDFEKYIDYLSHESDFKMNTVIYITNGSAENLIKKSSDGSFFLPDYLEVFLDDYTLHSSTNRIDLMDIFSEFNSTPNIMVIPTIDVKSENSTINVDVSGYYVYRDKKFCCTLTGDEATGYNLLHGLLSGEIIETKSKNGDNISLTVVKQKCDIKPIFKNGELNKIKISCFAESNISEDHSSNDYANREELNYIEQRQEEILKGYADACMKKLQKNRADAIFLYVRVRNRKNSYFKGVEKHWDEVFFATPYEVSVNVKIPRTYNSREKDE